MAGNWDRIITAMSVPAYIAHVQSKAAYLASTLGAVRACNFNVFWEWGFWSVFCSCGNFTIFFPVFLFTLNGWIWDII